MLGIAATATAASATASACAPPRPTPGSLVDCAGGFGSNITEAWCVARGCCFDDGSNETARRCTYDEGMHDSEMVVWGEKSALNEHDDTPRNDKRASTDGLVESAATTAAASSDGVTFHCVGACAAPRAVRSKGGNALMGGHMYPGVEIGTDLEAYRWFLDRAVGGDVLVLTADEPPCDIYNLFLLDMNGTHTKPNSVMTACFTSRAGASDAKLQTLLSGASAIFVTGGDQAKYYDFWANTRRWPPHTLVRRGRRWLERRARHPGRVRL